MEQIVEIMVEQAKLADEMFERHGVEEEEFNAAIIHHKIMEDPEIVKLQFENMRKMGFGGGMGGGMGF